MQSYVSRTTPKISLKKIKDDISQEMSNGKGLTTKVQGRQNVQLHLYVHSLGYFILILTL